MRLLKEGDRGEGLCPHCRALVEIRYERRVVLLENSGVAVENVLVGVCGTCGETAVIPAQSTPRLREARELKEEVLQARLPGHLEDALHLIADRYGADQQTFAPSLVRLYLSELAHSPRFARRVARLAASEAVCGGSTRRWSLRLRTDLLNEAWARAEAAGIDSKTGMVKAAVVAAVEDLLEPSSAAARRRKVEGLAAAS